MMFAVVPGLFAPLQQLASFLPQIAIMLVAAATAVFRPQAYRWAWQVVKERRRILIPSLAALAVGAGAWRLSRPGPITLPPPTEQEKREGWWSFRRDGSRTGSDGKPVGTSVRAIWKYREPTVDKRAFASSPAVWAGRAYIGCDNSALYCFNVDSGEEPLWVFPARYPVFSAPVIAGGRVYFGEGLHETKDAWLHCADAVTGKKLWEFKTTSHVEFPPTLADGRAYFCAGDDGLYCADAVTGGMIWQAKGMHLDNSPLLHNGVLYVGAGYGETGIAAYRASDGVRLWFTRTPASCWGDPALGPAGIVVGVGNGNFEFRDDNPQAAILCLSPETGGIKWRTPLADAVLAAAAISGNRVFIGDRSGDFSCFDATTGALLWKKGCGQPILSSAAVTENAVVYGCDGGHVHALSPIDGSEIWRYDASKDSWLPDERILSSPAVVDGRVYIGCNNFYFYCLGPKE
ncbi:MAG: PQQ-binding-like beta-propeller repeat protein [Planctomycetes bacterium]|nr:PQQ-binding-like beta-propeller repeat protein [Planctomycetota bacterium]